MTRTVIEYFKTTNNLLVPVELRFIRCKVITNGQESESFEWMDDSLWKELIEATKILVSTPEVMQKFSAFEPTMLSTSNLKIAYIIKDNIFKRQIFLDPSNTLPGLYQSYSSFEKMMVLSISLNNADVKLQDLQTALSTQQQVDGNLKISNYFMQTVSLSDLKNK